LIGHPSGCCPSPFSWATKSAFAPSRTASAREISGHRLGLCPRGRDAVLDAPARLCATLEGDYLSPAALDHAGELVETSVRRDTRHRLALRLDMSRLSSTSTTPPLPNRCRQRRCLVPLAGPLMLK
jgi:hypothetical protein